MIEKGVLYVVATPIGNLEDITLRALHVLKTVDLILAEDTRVTHKLLQHFEITTSVKSYHQHSTSVRTREIEQRLEEGKNIALVTDAGTPGISDPGNELVAVIARSEERVTKQSPEQSNSVFNEIASSSTDANRRTPRNDRTIVPVPGPCAAIAALSVCGFPTDKFIFLGFPPVKNKRRQFLETITSSVHTIVFYESGHRIKKCLNELAERLQASRKIVVARELTKKFETIYRGTAQKVLEDMKEERGEFVIVVDRV